MNDDPTAYFVKLVAESLMTSGAMLYLRGLAALTVNVVNCSLDETNLVFEAFNRVS
jgi:hypothetical protein